MGSIHRDAQRHFTAYPEHRAIIRPFLTAFSITKAYQPGTDDSAAFFLRAEPVIAEFLAIERELLLLYSPHRDFQARTLKLHDKLLAQSRERLDPSGSVIVSEAADAKTKLGDMMAKNAERAPIVVFTTSDLAAIKDVGGLRAHFAKQFYRRDVFGYESPLNRDTMFFGRQEVVTRILDRFRSNQNSGLFGLRRIGKTSVLLAVQRRCTQDKIGRALYIDLSNPGRWKLRWRDLLMDIVRDIASTVPTSVLERSRLFALTKAYSEERAAIRFRTDIQYLCTVVPGRRILIALDEVEFVTPSLSPATHWNSDFLPFWQAMRAVHQELAGAFSYVLAGVNPYIVEQYRVGGRWDNPLFSTIRVDYLQPFDGPTVRTMVPQTWEVFRCHL